MKLDILSARNTEVEKLNEAFDVVFPYSKISEKFTEDRIQTLTSKAENENQNNSSGQKKTKFYSENTE